MFRRVLVPLDGSETSERIVDQIDVIVPPGLRELLLVHVAPKSDAHEGRLGLLVEREVEERRTQLNELAEKLTARGLAARALLKRGKPVEQIVHAAIEEGADLIAMTKRGFGTIGRILVGSVADKVVRHSPVPVLLVRAETLFQRGARVVPPDRILVPVDGSERSMRILPSVFKMAHGFGSKITLAYVARENEPDGVLPYEHLDRPAARVVERTMNAAARKLRNRGATVNVVVVAGDPAERILELQKRQGHDLIAMTTHGRTGFERWLLGSVAEKVLKAADVPLLVLRNVHIGPEVYGTRRGAAAVR